MYLCRHEFAAFCQRARILPGQFESINAVTLLNDKVALVGSGFGRPVEALLAALDQPVSFAETP